MRSCDGSGIQAEPVREPPPPLEGLRRGVGGTRMPLSSAWMTPVVRKATAMRTIKTWVMLGMVCTLAACASKGGEQVTDAATRPLGDLNLVREEIPDVLRQAQAKPYQLPAEMDCASLVHRVHELDSVLGADLDTPPTKDNPGLIERGTDAAGDAAIGALARTAEGLIPFRGWVRKISGAERHSRKVEAAIAAGTVRRAFLKGVATTKECSWRADPAQKVAVTSTSAPD